MRVSVMGIDTLFGGGVDLVVALRLLSSLMATSLKKNGARRPSGGGSARRRVRGRLPRGNGGDIRRPINPGQRGPIHGDQ